MLLSLIVGLAVGFALSIPPGPIGVAVIGKALADDVRSGVQIALGASMMDMLYALIATLASSALIDALSKSLVGNGWISVAFQGVSIVVLVWLGIHYYKHPSTKIEDGNAKSSFKNERVQKLSERSPLLLGIALALTNLANPSFLPSMLYTASIVHTNGWVQAVREENILYAVGFGVGAALWFIVLLRGVNSLRSKLSDNFIVVIYRVAGGSLIVFAAILAYNVITSTNWEQLT